MVDSPKQIIDKLIAHYIEANKPREMSQEEKDIYYDFDQTPPTPEKDNLSYEQKYLKAADCVINIIELAKRNQINASKTLCFTLDKIRKS